tara:strand:- start:163 stop:315 length:153 start_codon:yes stop_codon:yes gene_type:complete
MVDTSLNKTDKISLTLQMSEFSVTYIRTSDCFNGNRTQIFQHFLAIRRAE